MVCFILRSVAALAYRHEPFEHKAICLLPIYRIRPYNGNGSLENGSAELCTGNSKYKIRVKNQLQISSSHTLNTCVTFTPYCQRKGYQFINEKGFSNYMAQYIKKCYCLLSHFVTIGPLSTFH